MTIINPKSIAGVTSITTASGADNLFTVHTNNTTERFRIDSTGTASFGGDVSIGGTVSVGGTITYEDVTNVDSVGLITARNGIEIGARPGVAASISVDGNMIVSGISTFGGDVQVPDKIIHSGDTNTAIRFPAADTISFETSGSEQLRVDSSGRLLLGLTSDSRTTSMTISGNSSNSASHSQLHMDSGTASISDGTSLGIIRFGATGDNRGADIRGVGDGTWSAGSSHPTRLAFYTNSSSGSSTPTERVRIDKDGHLKPAANDTYNLGTSSLKWANVYIDNYVYVGSTESSFKDNQLLFKSSGTAYIDHNTTGQSVQFRTSVSSSLDTNALILTSAGNATFSGTVNDSIGELRAFPVTAYGSNVVVGSHHAGKTLTNTSGGWTVNASTDFATGEVMRLVNKSGSSQTVFKGGSAQVYSSRDGGSGGDHSISARGSAILICTAADEYYLSGDI